ncbi:dockerin type I repeat protein [Ruminiclostridium sufflavum DSM 19573]|uniref:Glucanase n=1 Tax=Ruminiclostridium sufflavum DSM 19573 TaxID=1121337 RepID=A0A318XLI4_9FIRM|nr:glycoside hydrolase family 9 protein [Ruminiclostridium sufflavum]PYG86539.1 dockerin type I repeat protein [Ruminiclostridium sufflavum DSM 19573]
MAKVKKGRIYALILAAAMTVTQFGIQAETSAVSSFNYGEALQKSILFYEAQRSGAISTSSIPTRLTWRGDSQLTDGKKEGIDLTGGWVDAGDNIKFGITCAYSAGLLAFGAIQYKDAYVESGQMKWLQNQLRWINDYFIKCHTEPNVFWAQVGMTAMDHNNWMPIEVTHIVNDRTAIKLDKQNPGTEVAMDTAAAMAAASMVFRSSDPEYADKLVTHAKQLYEFGDTYRGKFSDVINKTDPQGAAAYTSHSGYNDELVWGSIWLYKALEAQKAGSGSGYLSKAKEYYNGIGKEANQAVHKYKWAHCWDDQSFGSYVLMSQIEPSNTEYLQDAERWLNWWTVGGTEHNADGTKIAYTPGGHAKLDSWGSFRYASTTALFAFAYSDNLTDASKKARYHDFAVKQINYIMGDNPRKASYIVGFGDNYPQHPHHRTAHSSWGQTMNLPSEHRHILYGALVGSPTAADGFNDSVDDYVSNEVAIDYNAGITGALARMYDEFGGKPISDSSFPLPDKPYSEKDEFPVFANTYFNGTSGTQFTLTVENRSAWPARPKNNLKLRYFFTLDAKDISDVSIKSLKWSKVSGPTVWDEANKIYYFTIDLSGEDIYPGYGWEVGGPEVDFTVSSASNQWDVTNDWSYKNWDKTYISGTRSYAPNFVVYEGDSFKRLAGNEPEGGASTLAETILTPVYPDGKSYFDISQAYCTAKVKLTDASSNPLEGMQIQWSAKDSNPGFDILHRSSSTDSEGIAAVDLVVPLPAVIEDYDATIDSYITASFAGNENMQSSSADGKVYGEIHTGFEQGDVNSDGSVDAIDFAVLKKYLLDNTVQINFNAADMNIDGEIDSIDYALLKKKLLN